MDYAPTTDRSWKSIDAATAGFNAGKLAATVAYAESHETSWPYDLEDAGSVPGLSQFEKPPWNEALGIFKPRGGPNGLLLKGGRIVARWGEPARADMTFSIAKSYLACLAGIAVGEGLIGSVDDPVASSVTAPEFASPHNRQVTWRHLLTQTSEWEGTLFDKPDLVDRNRQVGPGTDNSRKGEHRDLQAPGAYWAQPDRQEVTVKGSLQSHRISEFHRHAVSDGGPFFATRPDPDDPRAEALGRQLNELEKCLRGEPHLLATPAEALSVQERIEGMLSGIG